MPQKHHSYISRGTDCPCRTTGYWAPYVQRKLPRGPGYLSLLPSYHHHHIRVPGSSYSERDHNKYMAIRNWIPCAAHTYTPQAAPRSAWYHTYQGTDHAADPFHAALRTT